ncbi:GNAT family N-acetyltransferase [Planktothrix sp. FACHB-1355]|uniref:GNAT family N-acetyltransferase n=1 Tax=Aerosakkonema funiforme FACHB-1375 TaxID=2949571 RepID=A0A926VDE7_9CYAN|nr:GNAT family N-acetyltransferase [Aerosakkonema funiforme]MBD2181819.1 GNAT family N-acetyltransferase [Aerosakkonema funiforme FACHB-1375]MBD3559654.1 GNAT family N-acetyltransferase [Planktothrix sp. FACHB-1355]
MKIHYRDFVIRSWSEADRTHVAALIHSVLTEYGLPWQPGDADRDVLQIENFYLATGGEFWVVERDGQLVGTAAYYPIQRGKHAVEIRKMYLLPSVRRQGLGKFLLQQLESAIAARGFQQIWIQTASILKEAVQLYESSGYQRTSGIEAARCDRIYVKWVVGGG